jgi:NADP-dependent 3-hydroxy acid dehydrogenase YdfG
MTVFKEQVAVVTGASSGVGRAIALGLAEQGATLFLLGRKPEALEATAKAAQLTAPRVLSQRIDLTQDPEIHRLASRLTRDFTQIDMLVHSAGEISQDRMDRASIDALDRQYRINVRAPYLLTQALLPMLKSCQGQIVFINSSAGLNARAGVGQYAATKHALKGMADSLREEVNPEGLRILSVYLGRTATPMQAAVHEREGRGYRPESLLQPEDVAAVVINALGLPRTAEVTDIQIRPLKKLS